MKPHISLPDSCGPGLKEEKEELVKKDAISVNRFTCFLFKKIMRVSKISGFVWTGPQLVSCYKGRFAFIKRR